MYLQVEVRNFILAKWLKNRNVPINSLEKKYKLQKKIVGRSNILNFNLQIGLAVDDIKGVQKQAVLKRLAMLVTKKKKCYSSTCVF